MRLLAAAFLLLLGSDTNGRAGTSVHRHHSSHTGIATANHSALPATTPERKDVDTARPQLLASEASLHDGRVQSAPAPTRDSVSWRPYERTTDQAARPPPFQAWSQTKRSQALACRASHCPRTRRGSECLASDLSDWSAQCTSPFARGLAC